MAARLTAALLAALAAVTVGMGSPAQASWQTTGAGPARQAALTMPAGPVPTVTMASVLGVGFVYTLTWPATQVRAGQPATGYTIARSIGGALLGLGSCTDLTVLGIGLPAYAPATPSATTVSCTDVSLVRLTAVRYTITPVYSNWVGSPSTWSLPIG